MSDTPSHQVSRYRRQGLTCLVSKFVIAIWSGTIGWDWYLSETRTPFRRDLLPVTERESFLVNRAIRRIDQRCRLWIAAQDDWVGLLDFRHRFSISP
jgi:hypothetical protein